jgi:hypothetical protein
MTDILEIETKWYNKRGRDLFSARVENFQRTSSIISGHWIMKQFFFKKAVLWKSTKIHKRSGYLSDKIVCSRVSAIIGVKDEIE